MKLLLNIRIAARTTLEDKFRFGALCLVGALVTAAVLLAGSASTARSAEEDRSVDMTGVLSDAPSTSDLLVLSTTKRIEGQRVDVSFIEALSESSVRPTGVGQLPPVGASVVSPALQEMLESNKALAERFPVSDTIAPDGVLSGEQLLAYVRVSPGTLSQDGADIRHAVDGDFAGVGPVSRLMTVEHADRGPLTKHELAALIAADIPHGAFVNLGIGQPTTVADHLTSDQGVVLHTENGMLGMGRAAVGDEIDPDLINAGKIPVIETPGASYFHHADSFAMMRGGHLDVCVLGAFQVSTTGDLANWHTGEPDAIPAVGGAMDLAIGAKDVYVMMSLFTRDGTSKLVETCTYPLTGRQCVSRVYTDHGVFDLAPDGATLRETYGLSLDELRQRTGLSLIP